MQRRKFTSGLITVGGLWALAARAADITESDAALLGKMLILVARLADQLGVAYTGGQTGFRTVINTGPGGGQEVYHLHAHLLAGPRPWLRMG